MPTSEHAPDAHEWRLIILQLFRAQEAYLRAMKAAGGAQAIDQTWDRLQEASRHRDEFLGDHTAHGHDRLPRRA